MELASVVQTAPLATASVWLGLVAYLMARDRFRTWTEVLLLVLSASLGAFALSDFAFLNATTAGAAETAARSSLTIISAATASFALFALVLWDRMRPRFALVLLPSAAVIALVWIRIVVGVRSAADVGLPFRATYDPITLDLWVACALLDSALALGLLAKTFAALRKYAPEAARPLGLLLWALLLAVLFGASTNLVEVSFGLHVPPLFSTVLVVPGILAFAALAPARELPFVEAAARWKSGGYGVRAAILMHEDGTTIARRGRPGGLGVDPELFGSTLDVIQNFMRTSFPRLDRGWLRSVAQGEYTLVIERSPPIVLVLVLEGAENDQLRRLMREALRRYVRENPGIFEGWRGSPEEGRSAEAMLSRLVSR